MKYPEKQPTQLSLKEGCWRDTKREHSCVKNKQDSSLRNYSGNSTWNHLLLKVLTLRADGWARGRWQLRRCQLCTLLGYLRLVFEIKLPGNYQPFWSELICSVLSSWKYQFYRVTIGHLTFSLIAIIGWRGAKDDEILFSCSVLSMWTFITYSTFKHMARAFLFIVYQNLCSDTTYRSCLF